MHAPSVARLSLISLLALIPVAAFLLGRGGPEVSLSLVSVLLIVGSVYVMVSGEGHADSTTA